MLIADQLGNSTDLNKALKVKEELIQLHQNKNPCEIGYKVNDVTVAHSGSAHDYNSRCHAISCDKYSPNLLSHDEQINIHLSTMEQLECRL